MDLDERRRRFLESAVWGPFDEARQAGGSRNAALNAAAFALGPWVGGGVISRQEAEAACEAAAAALVGPGFTLREARYTIRRSLAQGEREPRHWPEDIDPARAGGGHQAPDTRHKPAPAPPPVEPPPPRPPAEEVAALWFAALPPTAATPEAEACAAWLRSRGLDPAEVARLNLARALPPVDLDVDMDAAELRNERAAIAEEQGATAERALAEGLRAARLAFPGAVICIWPALACTWAALGRLSWRDNGHLLILPAWSAAGELVSLRARFVLPGKPKLGDKAIGPAAGPGSGRGLVLANRPALALLRGRWPEGVPPRVAIVEGEPDWLHACCRRPELPILGVVAGSWTAELTARIPDGARVVIWTHTNEARNEAGDKYAARILESFAGRRVDVLRGRWPR